MQNSNALPHRIAAGAIVFSDGKVLLVRYPDENGGSYLVAPGGRAEEGETVSDAAVRETLEETGVAVAVRKVLFIEDLLCRRFKMCKVWFLCDVVGGEPQATDAAREEGIVEARWHSRAELESETVFPPILTQHDWAAFGSSDWTVKWSELRRPAF